MPKEKTPYYLFVEQVDIIDQMQKRKIKSSYLLHKEMGYNNLFNLFNDGKAHEFMIKLIDRL